MPEKPTYEELEQRIQELEASKSKSMRMLKGQQQKETLYGNVFKNMLHEVHVWDLVYGDDGNIKTWKLLDANPTALRVWDKELSEIVGKTTDKIFPNSNATELFKPIIEKIFAEDSPHTWESYFPDTNQVLYMTSIPLGSHFISTGFDITEIRQAEEVLRQKNEMLKRTEAIAQVGSWEWEIETDTVIWSEELYRIFQMDPNTGPPSWAEHPNIYHPEDFETLEQLVKTAIADAKPYEIVLRALRKDGETRICIAKGFPETKEDGQVVRLYGLLQDITEQKQSEDAIRKQNYYLEKAQELGKIGTWELDLINDILVLTDENCRIFGVPEGSVVDYETFINKVHPDDREHVDREWKAGIEGKAYDIEHRLLLDDEVRWVREKADVVFDDKGKAVSAIGFTQDITERKMAEDALIESEERYRSLFDESPISLWEEDFSDVKTYIDDLRDSGVKDLRAFFGNHPEAVIRCATLIKVVDVNSATLELYDAETIKNFREGLSTFFDEEALDIFIEELIALANGETTFESEVTTRTLKGNKNQIFMKCSVAKGFEENLSKVYVSIIDISDRKKAELEKEKLQAQLVQTQKMESIGNLAGGVAHDFNNMLGVILGHTELALLQVDEHHELYDDLKEIQKAATRSTDITKQLLAFARKQTIAPRPLDLNDTVENMLNMLSRLIGEDIDMVWKPSTHLWPVKMDPSQIDQILVNLCANARDAISGVGKIIIETEEITVDEAFPLLPGLPLLYPG